MARLIPAQWLAALLVLNKFNLAAEGLLVRHANTGSESWLGQLGDDGFTVSVRQCKHDSVFFFFFKLVSGVWVVIARLFVLLYFV